MTSQAVPSRTIYLVPARTVKAVQRVVPVRNQVQTVHAQSYGQKRPAPISPGNVDPIEELLGETTNSGVPRKRERLTHLTAEEKLNRRKMKNRVAAQTARDRKKIRSQRLEDVVRDLLRENEQLRIENAELRETVAQNQTETPSTTSCQIATPMTTFGSAAFISGTQPRYQVVSGAVNQNKKQPVAMHALIRLALLSLLPPSFKTMNSNASSRICKTSSTSTSSPLSCPSMMRRSLSKTLNQRQQTYMRMLKLKRRRQQWSRIS